MKEKRRTFAITYEESLRYGFIKGNRKLNQQHVKFLEDVFTKDGEFLLPVLVNKANDKILDGQHRMTAFQNLVRNKTIPAESTIEILFKEISSIDDQSKAIIGINTNQKGWVLINYVGHYKDNGNKNYQNIEEWCMTHPLLNDGKNPKIRYGSAIINGKSNRNSLVDGNFQYTDEQWDEADKIYNELSSLVDVMELRVKGDWFEAFAVAWHEIRKMYDFSIWVKELRKKKYKDYPKNNKKDWRSLFSEVIGEITKSKSQHK